MSIFGTWRWDISNDEEYSCRSWKTDKTLKRSIELFTREKNSNWCLDFSLGLAAIHWSNNVVEHGKMLR